VTGRTPFVDMEKQLPEFQKAVLWAYNTGVVKGDDATHFKPDKAIQRQEAMTIIFRYSGGQVGVEAMLAPIYAGSFKDYSKIDSWAVNSMNWAIYHEIISGDEKSKLCPTDSATRAEVAKILVGYMDKITKN